MMNIVYVAVGKEDIYKQAYYSILSFFKYNKANKKKIVVYTDNPAFFENMPVTVETITPAMMKKRQGNNGYFYRFKICALLMHAKKYRDSFIFIDTDTLWTDKPYRLKSGTSVMHMKEARMGSYDGRGYKNIFDTCYYKNKPFKKAIMYNSGVIGLHKDDLGLLPKMLKLCDKIYNATGQSHSEQAAISYILQHKTHVHEMYDRVLHYWGYKGPIMHKLHETIDINGKIDAQMQQMKDFEYSGGNLQFMEGTGDILVSFFKSNPAELLKLQAALH